MSTLAVLLEKEREREEHTTIGMLEVLLVDAEDLKDTESIGDIDPYVLVRYGNQERKTKVARGQGDNPVWNQTVTFKVGHSNDVNEQHKINLIIMDKDTFSKEDLVGELTIYTKDVISLGMENGTAELPPQKYRVVRTNKKYHGEISVGIRFVRKIENEMLDEYVGGWKLSSF